LQLRLLSAVTCSLTIAVILAPSALGAATGGVAAGGTTLTGGKPVAAPAPATHLHLAPVTSRNASLAYKGPVFEKTATGAVVPYQPQLPAAQASASTGGSAAAGAAAGAATPVKPELLVPGSIARYVGGIAAAPMAAPAAIQQIIWAGNQIIGLPYIFGGGHASFISAGYDCSGTVSFALHGASLLSSPEDSSEFEAWGSHGQGRWVTIFANPGHAYMTVAGLRLDTSSADDPSNQQGPRWRPLRPGNGGFTVRHPLGL
jgi:hypothetical protein